MVEQKKPSNIKKNESWTSPEAPREPASRAHLSSKKRQLELKMLFEFASIGLCVFKKWSENAAWTGFHYKCSKKVFQQM